MEKEKEEEERSKRVCEGMSENCVLGDRAGDGDDGGRTWTNGPESVAW